MNFATLKAGREMDEAVARLVIGKPWDDREGAWKVEHGDWHLLDEFGHTVLTRRIPRFSEFLSSDFTVLEHVRRSWDEAALRRMAGHLVALWSQDSDMAHIDCEALNYRPGDYSRAALMALETT